ncbi:MAG: UbiX family flavin prenyltransferase [Candidatus Lokiarchaeota archaeon]|nr:UbiX family flavin prenyltransferase [Candidatus Lokiarchaeota archaeon]
MKMIVIAITGATGITLAIEILNTLKEKKIQTELIISKTAEEVITLETNCNISEIKKLATYSYDDDQLSAPPASGSHKFKAMIIIPCSMKTLASIAHGYANNLITRAADVAIKEKRPLILSVRESPFSVIHLKNMIQLAKLGVIIAPPIPSYYIKPKNVDELTKQTAGRILDLLNIDNDIKRWGTI